MIKKILNYITSSTRRRAYRLLFLALIIGLAMMVMSVSTHEVDEIELSEPYEIVIFITFLFGMFLSFFGLSLIFSIYIINLQHNRLMEEMEK